MNFLSHNFILFNYWLEVALLSRVNMLDTIISLSPVCVLSDVLKRSAVLLYFLFSCAILCNACVFNFPSIMCPQMTLQASISNPKAEQVKDVSDSVS